MSIIYAMRRANGDWFAHEVNGRLRIPLFHTMHDAFMSRLHNFGMQPFEPVTFNARLLKEIDSKGAGRNVDFCMIDDPFVNLKRAELVDRSRLSLLMRTAEGG